VSDPQHRSPHERSDGRASLLVSARHGCAFFGGTAGLAGAFIYTTNDNGTITITGYAGSESAMVIPDSINGFRVTNIGTNAFGARPDICSVVFPDSVATICDNAFGWCQNLTNATLGRGITRIGEGAFNTTGLRGVRIPENVTSIGRIAFGYCLQLAAITVDFRNTNFVSMDGVLFNGSQTTLIQCPGGKVGSFTVPGDITCIANGAFYGCIGLTNVVIPDNVSRIEDGAFGWSGLVSVSIGAGVTNIPSQTFAVCRALASITIPLRVVSIGAGAFTYCVNLTNVAIPDNVTEIGDGAFAWCNSLASVTIGKGVARIGAPPFLACQKLTAIAVDVLNPHFSSADGVLFDKSQRILIECPAGKAGSYTAPSSLESVGNDAFLHCYGITNVLLPEGVTSIGFRGFGDCTHLASVVLPNTIMSIGTDAFVSCWNLSSVTIPIGVTNIEATTFMDCIKLSRIVIPDSVSRIEANAFNSCVSLTNVTVGESVRSIGDAAFNFCIALTGLYFEGNAPDLGTGVFQDDNNATVYYLPDTADWGATFGGRPTAPWLPQIETGGSNSGARTNQFGFTINWASGRTVIVEASPDPANPTWSPISTNTLANGTACFRDPEWTKYSGRFYRLRSP
jgi:hypothetical protein